MTTRTSLETKVPTPPPSSPLSSELPNIGSLTITDVSGEARRGAQKSSNEMQDLQEQQTRPAATPTLAPSRVNTSTSVADDLDALLDETLEEFHSNSSSSSTSSVQRAAFSSLSFATNEVGFHEEGFQSSSSSSSSSSVQSSASSSFAFSFFELNFQEIDELLASICAYPFAKLMAPPDLNQAID
jgi:hypothetical protein